METEDVPFRFLQEITDGFSETRKIGKGAFAEVYKGVTKNGDDVAVKIFRVRDGHDFDYNNKHFQNELYILRKLKHQNIVQVFGYCNETEKKPLEYDGRVVLVESSYRALCCEYLHNGSLQQHLSNEFCGLDWHARFKIIKGICEGLKYIHEELEKPIYHLDLKPANILLDKDMVPKIADFGLSRIFGKELTRTAQNPYGTLGYQPPEYIDRREISGKFDIFSLGAIMIRILSGPYPDWLSMSSDDFINQVQKNWRKRMQATCSSDPLLEQYCHQVETCTKIALSCVKRESTERPNIRYITEKMNETETAKLSEKQCGKTVSKVRTHNNKTEMRKESEDITSRHKNIDLMTVPNCYELPFVDRREASSHMVEEFIVGRTEERMDIMASLLGMSQNFVILPIYGIGGIGKTTFARLIYNDPLFKSYAQVWVHVSQRFDLNKIYGSIISQLSEKEIKKANDRPLVHSFLMKILIVLDDIWEDNPFQLQELKNMIYFDNSSVIILVTTRSKRVAEIMSTNIEPYNILPLKDDMCWNIIKRRSGFEARDDKEQLMGLGLEIAKKCGGVPLAAQSLGFILLCKDYDHWMKVKDSDIWNGHVLSNDDVSLTNQIIASLRLTYSYMNPCLKQCFTYCAIFPKGHKIVKNDIIYQWVSLGYIKPTKLLSNIQLCEKYIAQLLGLSFFQHSVPTKKTVGVYHEDVTVFTMHDLVHDLAKSVMVEEIWCISVTGESRISYALLNDCTKSLDSFTLHPTKIRALCVLESDKTVLSGAPFSSAKYLRVLDLSECSMQKFPNSIGNLKQLRYLKAPRIQHQSIPDCMTKLSKLIYLSFRGSFAILALPESIGEMEELIYLDLSGCSEIEKLPVSFGKLKKLVHLDLSNCYHVTNVSEPLESLTNLEYLNLSCCSNIGELPEHLGGLLELRNLNLSHNSYIKGLPNAKVLVTLTKLESLNLATELSFIKNLPEALSRLNSLMYLNLSGVDRESFESEGPITFGNLKNLVYLDLSHCKGVNSILKAFDDLTELQYLNLLQCSCFVSAELDNAWMRGTIHNIHELRYLNLSGCSDYKGAEATFLIFLEHIGYLRKLEHLDLSLNGSLRSVPNCFASLRKLHTLDLSSCLNLQSLPEEILVEMDNLEFLDVRHCPQLQMSKGPRLRKMLSNITILSDPS